jgi:hypothetical protein
MYRSSTCLARRFFRTSAHARHENPLVRLSCVSFRLCPCDGNIRRVFLEVLDPHLKCRVKVALFRSDQYQMSRKFWQSQVGKAASERAPSQVSTSKALSPFKTDRHPSVNLAFALALLRNSSSNYRLRVGILDLDIFGPSIPTLMGLQKSEEPRLTSCKAPCRQCLCSRLPRSSWRYRPACQPRSAYDVHGLSPPSVSR